VRDTARQPELCYIDVGGTFTDAFIVDGAGEYVTGKAPSTPGDVASGFFAAIDAAASAWEMSSDDILKSLKILGYGSTVVLNTILTRSGSTPGLMITKGFEGILRAADVGVVVEVVVALGEPRIDLIIVLDHPLDHPAHRVDVDEEAPGQDHGIPFGCIEAEDDLAELTRHW